MSQWFSELVQEKLKEAFAQLTRNVTIVTFTKDDQESTDMTTFMEELVALDDRLTLQKGSEEQVSSYGVTRFPTAALLDEDGEYTGIKFAAVPKGNELNAMSLAIYNVGSRGQYVGPHLIGKIKALPAAKLQICISLKSNECHQVVTTAHRISALNYKIETEMLNIDLEPELKEEKRIMTVPAIIINGEEVKFGLKNIDEIIEIVQKSV